MILAFLMVVDSSAGRMWKTAEACGSSFEVLEILTITEENNKVQSQLIGSKFYANSFASSLSL